MPSLLRRLQRAAERDTAVTFVVGGDEVVVPWRELHEQAKGYAAALQARGVRPGDHVALLSPTTRELVTAIQAAWLCGAAVVVLPLPMRLGSLEEFVAQTRARVATADVAVLLVDGDLAGFLEPAAGDPPVVVLDELGGLARPDRYLAPPADPEALALSIVGTGHLLFAGELGARPDADAVTEVVQSLLIAVERQAPPDNR